MCGILGAIRPGCGIETDAFLDGLESLRHRGPDGRGVLLARLRDGWLRPVYDPAPGSLRTFEREDPDVMLGHARLSIIDLSSVASQPMSNERGDVWVVFNGEIYNHAELRRNLVALGHRFRTDHSDTEVLVHGYEEWGETLVERLRGMFAFATLSLRDRTLFLARDRFGEKPLYLAMGLRGVCFASELKALLAGGFVEREISPQALGDYLVHGFIPAPRSIFKGVIKLAAAQCVTIDIEHPDNYRPRTYWRPSTYLDTAIPAEQAIEEFNHELNRSILMRMQSDVPLGAFLSGGLDSTTVVKHMASAGGPVNTFTIGFRDAKYDEARYARMAANCYRTRHLVQILQPDDMLRVLPIIERHYDEPFADSSAIPTYLVSRMARETVTVALSGDGGDELLCGYGYYRILHRMERILGRLPVPAIDLLSKMARRLYPKATRGYGLINLLGSSDHERHSRHWSDDHFINKVHFDRSLGIGDSLRGLWDETGGAGVERMSAVDSRFYVPEDLMVKVDRASMAVSLEVRSPLLDHLLFEAAARIPLVLRFDGRLGKIPFRRSLEADLGSDFVDRPKSGFAVPLGAWFKGPLRDQMHDTLLDPAGIVSDIVPRQDVARLIRMHLRGWGSRDQSHRLWRLFALQRWNQVFGRAPTPPHQLNARSASLNI